MTLSISLKFGFLFFFEKNLLFSIAYQLKAYKLLAAALAVKGCGHEIFVKREDRSKDR